ncbi:PAS domain S-box-containing protein [Filimonas lacunae]|uniref:histidine kinase n=1 Tax=Filimonas lacunae TaxID=477680 RepID=A0A173MQS6_9BACT|nr:PAS domain S-box protein [Filimonas lacunae]BAV09800.1 diguanylate cyclase/phosphodiesterase (GGDEF & EAL domains) with PAS/PAC sensor [Filimonas lacunae]SIS79128.1 PAS domain S-box-containing protein [Filimonas lacunae]
MKRLPLRVAIIYFLAACTWIVVTDLALRGVDTAGWAYFQTVKGLLFALITALIFYVVGVSSYRRILRRELDYRRLFEGSPHPIVIYDIETLYILKANEAFLKRYEYDERDLERLQVMDICTVDERLQALDFIRNVVNKPISESGVWKQVTRSGQEFYASITSHATDFRNRRARMIVITDVDEQLKARNAIRSTEKKLKSLIDSTSDIIFMVDIDMNLVTINAAFEALYNNSFPGAHRLYTPISLYELPIKMFGEEWLKNIKMAMKGESVRKEDKYEIPSTGEEICLDISLNPIYDVHDQVIGVGCISRNISDRKKTEDLMSRQLTQLREIAWIQSHELRQPLTNIMGLASIIESEVESEKDVNDEEVKKHVLLMQRACDQLDQVVKGIVKKTAGIS